MAANGQAAEPPSDDTQGAIFTNFEQLLTMIEIVEMLAARRAMVESW
jgi:hypothetical protein